VAVHSGGCVRYDHRQIWVRIRDRSSHVACFAVNCYHRERFDYIKEVLILGRLQQTV